MANPPGGIGGEFETFTPVELFYGVHEAEVAFLDEVKQGQTRCLVLLGNGYHKTQVGLHELTFSACAESLDFAQFTFAGCTHAGGLLELFLGSLAFFDFFCETHFVVFGEQNVLANVGEIEAYEVFVVSIDAIFGHVVPPQMF